MLSLRVKKPEKYMLNLVKLKKPTSLIGSQSLRLGIHFQEIKKNVFFFGTSILIVTDVLLRTMQSNVNGQALRILEDFWLCFVLHCF